MRHEQGSGLRLTVQDLACRRSGRLVFQNLSFSLGAGEALAVTGRNGAGKSSLLAILAGRLRPEGGAIILEGAGERPLPECLHLVGHRDALKAALTAEENLRFARDLLRNPALTPGEALERVGLAHAARLPVGYLSAGQRRRVALARLLIARRPLWLLDEPTAALDVGSQETLRGIMAEHLQAGGLVVAATHQPLGVRAAEVRIERSIASPLEGGVDAQSTSGEGRSSTLPKGAAVPPSPHPSPFQGEGA